MTQIELIFSHRKKGPKHWERNGHWYFLSTNVSTYADIKSDWLDARNLCRKHCMDAISIETVEENDMVLDILEKRKEKSAHFLSSFSFLSMAPVTNKN